jgi:Domain of unknown function (DUF3597)
MKRALCCATLALALAAGCAPDQPSKIVLDEPAVVAPPPVEQLTDELRERVAQKVEAIEAKIDAVAREAEARVEEFTERLEEKIETKAEAAREWLLDAHLDALARRHFATTGEALDWRGSVVDLIKVIGFDAAKAARRELAQAFGYPRRYAGSARDNVWLHRRLLQWLRGEG